MATKIIREICERCCKQIYSHNRILICNSCGTTNHLKCGKKFYTYNQIKDMWSCKTCLEKHQELHYNPFDSIVYNEFIDESPEIQQEIELIQDTLKNCSELNFSDLNDLHMDRSNIPVLFNNIDGMSSNFDPFHALISTTKLSFGVICLAETNINAKHKDLYNLNGYQSFFNDKMTNKRKGSGLGIYINDRYVYEPIDQLNTCTQDFESLFVKISNTDTPLNIGIVYRPPNGRLKEFLDQMESFFSTLPSNTIITGDYNINLHSKDRRLSKFENVYFGSGYSPIISLSTHFKPGCKPSCLDNMLVSNLENISKTGVLAQTVSHHHPIFCMYKLSCPVKDNIPDENILPCYDYCESNIIEFNTQLHNKLSLTSFSPDETGFNRFISYFKDTLEECCRLDPTKLKSKRNRILNPWITYGLINSINYKNFLYNKWKTTCTKKCAKGDESVYLKYKNYRKNLKYLIARAKKLHYSRRFDNVQGDSKKTWKLINELRGKCKNRPKPHFIIDGHLVVNRRTIAQKFNEYFTSLASKLNSQAMNNNLPGISIAPIQSFEEYLGTKTKNSMYLTDCTTKEIFDIIKNLDSSKSSDLPIHLLKKCNSIISPYLSNFFTLFLKSGTFPLSLKHGCITPVFKKGSKQLLENYRPISTLPTFGKLFEKVIFTRMSSFFTSNNLLHPNQFGFRSKHSTSHAINYSIDHIISETENKKHVLGIFIDLSKAFDTISHSKLLYKLDHYGIRSNALSLIKEYLTDRTQLVNFDGEKSDYLPVQHGVPQGSILGPLLFIIYVNDIVKSSNLGNFVMFADGTNIFVSGESKTDTYNKANILLSQLSRYMFDNQLHINHGKCVYMYFSPKKTPSKCKGPVIGSNNIPQVANLTINGTEIKQVRKARFLGIIIDDDIGWKDHLNALEEKLNSCIITIKRIKKFIPTEHYNKLYYSLFSSHLSYGISVWGGVADYRLSKIFSIQKRCIRLLFGNIPNFDHLEYYQTCARARTYEEHMSPKDYSLEHTKPLFKEKGFLTVHNLYKLFIFNELFKIQKYHCPTSISDTLNLYRRSFVKLTLSVPTYNHNKSRQQFFYSGIGLWNKLLPHVLKKQELDEKRHIIIPGSAKYSDFTSPITYVKNTLKNFLLKIQCSGNTEEWVPQNFSLDKISEIDLS